MWFLVFVHYTFIYVDGYAYPIKICEYQNSENKTPREMYNNRKAFYLHPDHNCPDNLADV